MRSGGLVSIAAWTTASTPERPSPAYVSVALGAIVLNEELNLRIIAGMVVVLVGLGMTRWKNGRRRRWPPRWASSRSGPPFRRRARWDDAGHTGVAGP